MNNTRRTLAVSVILAVTLVVGGMLAATTATTQSAFADKGKDNGKGNNGYTLR